MRTTAILLLLKLMAPATGQAQPYHASVLWAAPDSAAAGDNAQSPAAPDSTIVPALHKPPVARFDPTRGEPSALSPILCGLVVGAAVATMAALVGNALDDGSGSDDIPYGAAFGYLIGETIGVPLGVHLGNARRGNFAADLGISAATHVGALALTSVGGEAGYVVGVAGQIALTTVVDRSIGRTRARHRFERAQAAEDEQSP